jgi:hypothetical protein
MGIFDLAAVSFAVPPSGRVALLAVYLVACAAIEAWVLGAVLRLRYRRAMLYSLVAVAASTMLGGPWRFAGEGGWKIPVWSHQYAVVAVLLARSFVIAFAAQGVALALMLGGQLETRRILAATATANAAGYALNVAMLVAVAMKV